ncbi:hypothetical protein MTCOM_14080 [Moorella thermoacetica]|uniref:ABC transporter substrate-binding protein n=1 Tax=Neomoorella thermoacetica TaxID=1525 RepID=UPI0030CF0FAE
MYRAINKKLVTFSLISMLLLMTSFILAGCGNQQNKPPAATEKTVMDMAGKNVKLPVAINRVIVTCYGGASHELVVLGAGDKIVAQPSMKRFPQLVKMMPHFKDLPDPGTFDNVNIEAILKLKPDLVVASVTSTKGNQKIEEAGIPVINVSTGVADIEALKKEFRMMGEVLNKSNEANALVSYWDNWLKTIKERVSKIPEAKRKRVYYMLRAPLHTNGSAWWGQTLITAAGGLNVASEIGKGRDINIEQLLTWNPDVIIISSNEGRFIPISEVKNNPQFKDLQAVKEGQLYQCPIGTFWWDRPSPEGILGILWLAQILYPENFRDVDLTQETIKFYQTFYHYNLTEQDVKEFFNPGPLQ